MSSKVTVSCEEVRFCWIDTKGRITDMWSTKLIVIFFYIRLIKLVFCQDQLLHILKYISSLVFDVLSLFSKGLSFDFNFLDENEPLFFSWWRSWRKIPPVWIIEACSFRDGFIDLHLCDWVGKLEYFLEVKVLSHELFVSKLIDKVKKLYFILEFDFQDFLLDTLDDSQGY